MRITIALAILGIFLTGCSLSGGFGKATDEALDQQIPYSQADASALAVSDETYQMLRDGFHQSNVYLENQGVVVDSMGALKMMFQFMDNKVNNHALDYATYKTGFEFIEWIYLAKIAGTLDPMVLDGELSDPKDSLIYYLTSTSIRERLYVMGGNIEAAERDIRGKASANDAAELRSLFKSISPFLKMMPTGGLGGLL